MSDSDPCEHCGQPRPTRDRPLDANQERFTLTFEDYSPSTGAYEKIRLCGECWRNLRQKFTRGAPA